MPTLEEAQVAARELFGISVRDALRKDRKSLEYIASGSSSVFTSPEQIAHARTILDYKRVRDLRWKGD